jgi:tetratricopeptide (TPR) repeat protein
VLLVRPAARYPRALRDVDRKLLWQEIDNVKRLHQATPRDSSDRPRVTRRLADDYAELAATHERDQIEAEILSDEVQRINPVRAALLRERAREAARVVDHGRRRAIELYRELARDHPRYCHLPGRKRAGDRGCGDEVIHHLAVELEAAGMHAQALDAYRALLRGWPGSAYARRGELAIAEQLFDEARSDDSAVDPWQRTQAAYQAVLRGGHDDDLATYALYKLGHVHWSRGRFERALDALVAVVAQARRRGGSSSAGLLEASLRDLVTLFAATGKSDQALAFFLRLSGDRAGETRRTFALMEELGRRLAGSGRHRQAIAIYRQLLGEHRAGDRCQYLAAVVRATLAASPTDKEASLAALTELRGEARARRDTGLRQTKSCDTTTVLLVYDTASGWHAEAAGTRDATTVKAALQLYDWLAADAVDPEIARLKLARFDETTRPSPATLAYRRGDLLHAMGRWHACGHAFGAAFEAQPRGLFAAQALSAAADCWLRSLDGARQPTERDRGAMLAIFDRAACALAADSAETGQRLLAVRLARADALRARGDELRALQAYRAIALDHPQSEGALTATRQLISSLQVPEVWNSAAACGLAGDLEQLTALHCERLGRGNSCAPLRALAARLR